LDNQVSGWINQANTSQGTAEAIVRPLISGLTGRPKIANPACSRNATGCLEGWDILAAQPFREARKPVAKDTSKTMSLVGHLSELRRRLIYCLVVVVACVIAAFVFKHRIFAVLMHPLQGTHIDKLTTLGVAEAFMQVLKVSIYAGLLVSLPFILYQFWAFVMPALHGHERRNVLLYTVFTTVLFLGGVVFAYYLVLPVGLKFLVDYGVEDFNQFLQAERYLSFVSLFLLSFGLVFELPLVMLLLAWARVVDHLKMRKVRRYAIVVEAILAMVITPSQDPFSMMLMLVPLMLLYEVGVLLARLVSRRRTRHKRPAALSEVDGSG
jgi:sec-independent protein translocase protein TatC